MRVLLDQGTPVPVRQYLVHHTVRTAFQEGWATLANGELLTAAEAAGFEVSTFIRFRGLKAQAEPVAKIVQCGDGELWKKIEDFPTASSRSRSLGRG